MKYIKLFERKNVGELYHVWELSDFRPLKWL